MNSAIERLLSLRVEDIMSKQVVQIPAHESMTHAAEVFAKHRISGAPVVDEQGRCVGILTGADFVMRQKVQEAAGESPAGAVEHVLVQDTPEQPFHIEEVAEDMVSTHMSTGVQSIAESESLMTAARALCAAHIHRLVVLDEGNRPKGVISTLDIVAAMIHAIEE